MEDTDLFELKTQSEKLKTTTRFDNSNENFLFYFPHLDRLLAVIVLRVFYRVFADFGADDLH